MEDPAAKRRRFQSSDADAGRNEGCFHNEFATRGRLYVCIIGCSGAGGLDDAGERRCVPRRSTDADKDRDDVDDDDGLQGIIKDCYDVYRFFKEAGAKIVVYEARLNGTPGERLKDEIKKFLLEDESENKLLYYSGHCSPRGDLALGQDCSYSFQEFMETIFCGYYQKTVRPPPATLIVILDCCFSGAWPRLFHAVSKGLRSPDPLAACLCDNVLDGEDLWDAVPRSSEQPCAWLDDWPADEAPPKIVFFCSSLPSMVSQDSNDGGDYTKELLSKWSKEGPAQPDGDERGWGIEALRHAEIRPVLKAKNLRAQQQDVAVRFFVNADGAERWHWEMESRAADVINLLTFKEWSLNIV